MVQLLATFTSEHFDSCITTRGQFYFFIVEMGIHYFHFLGVGHYYSMDNIITMASVPSIYSFDMGLHYFSYGDFFLDFTDSYFTSDTYANEHSARAARLAAGLCADLAVSIMSGRSKNGFALVGPIYSVIVKWSDPLIMM